MKNEKRKVKNNLRLSSRTDAVILNAVKNPTTKVLKFPLLN